MWHTEMELESFSICVLGIGVSMVNNANISLVMSNNSISNNMTSWYFLSAYYMQVSILNTCLLF